MEISLDHWCYEFFHNILLGLRVSASRQVLWTLRVQLIHGRNMHVLQMRISTVYGVVVAPSWEFLQHPDCRVQLSCVLCWTISTTSTFEPNRKCTAHAMPQRTHVLHMRQKATPLSEERGSTICSPSLHYHAVSLPVDVDVEVGKPEHNHTIPFVSLMGCD